MRTTGLSFTRQAAMASSGSTCHTRSSGSRRVATRAGRSRAPACSLVAARVGADGRAERSCPRPPSQILSSYIQVSSKARQRQQAARTSGWVPLRCAPRARGEACAARILRVLRRVRRRRAPARALHGTRARRPRARARVPRRRARMGGQHGRRRPGLGRRRRTVTRRGR